MLDQQVHVLWWNQAQHEDSFQGGRVGAFEAEGRRNSFAMVTLRNSSFQGLRAIEHWLMHMNEALC